MSRFSGKCDLYDHVFMKEESDEEFNKFLKKTKGKIYRKIPLKLTRGNIKGELARDPKRFYKNKDGGYTYNGIFYKTLKELNKVYHVLQEITIKDKIDLVKYYPYIISFMYASTEREFIVISEMSYPEMRYLEEGHNFKLYDYYNNMLNDELRKLGRENDFN